MINRLKNMLGMQATDSSAPSDMQAQDAGQSVQRGFSNADLGYGGSRDVIGNTTIASARGFTAQVFESLYVNTWAAPKVIDLIVDDVFSPGIVWANDEDEATARIMQALDDMGAVHKFAGAVKAARLYGSSILILAPRSQDFMEELDVENIKEGDITHLLVVPKEQLEIWQAYTDPRQPNYGEVYSYKWSLTTDGKSPIPGEQQNQISQISVHASRCLRFDGIKSNTDVGWVYTNLHEDRRWGVSLLTRCYDDIIQDLIMNAGSAELVKRSSVPVIKMDYFRDVLARGAKGDNIHPETYAQQVSAGINNAKVLFMDSNDEIDNLNVRASGVDALVEGQTNRLAMIAGVPVSRFKGESATGLSATGNGDARDWRISVEGYRKDVIDEPWGVLMNALARNIGLAEVPEWEWGMLGEMDSSEQASIAKVLAETVKMLVESGIIDETEARMVLNTSELIDLDEDWVPPIDEEMPMPEPNSNEGLTRDAN